MNKFPFLHEHQIESKKKLIAFTLIELLIVIAIIAILAAILFTVFGRARENARRSSCQSNAKQIMLGIAQYTQDYDEKYMPMFVFNPVRYWPEILVPYMKSTQVFNCPSNSGAAYVDITNVYSHYGLNTCFFEDNEGIWGRSMTAIEKPAETLMLADSVGNPRIVPGGYQQQSVYDVNQNHVQYRHLETTTVGFFDGHVKSMRKSAVEVKNTTDGSKTGLTGDEQFTLWNAY